MIFTVLFEDNTAKEALRPQHMQAHLDFLARQNGILGAGPLFQGNGTGHGGMWLIEAEAIEDVTEMTRTDPFFDTGLRKKITVLEWRQVVRDGKRL